MKYAQIFILFFSTAVAMEAPQENSEHASQIEAQQIPLNIVNNHEAKYLLEYALFNNGRKVLKNACFREIDFHETASIPLDLGLQQHLMLSIKRCSQTGEPVSNALIIALAKHRSGFSWAKTQQPALAVRVAHQDMPVAFNGTDQYLFILELDETCIHNSHFSLQVVPKSDRFAALEILP